MCKAHTQGCTPSAKSQPATDRKKDLKVYFSLVHRCVGYTDIVCMTANVLRFRMGFPTPNGIFVGTFFVVCSSKNGTLEIPS